MDYDRLTVPAWVKSVCKDYGNDGIDEQTFLNCIQFLIDHGIITLPTATFQSSQVTSAQKTTTINVQDDVNVVSK